MRALAFPALRMGVCFGWRSGSPLAFEETNSDGFRR
jgi:hypothetical protein